jgi:hypothetical protein
MEKPGGPPGRKSPAPRQQGKTHTSTIITSQKILNCTQYRDNNNNKGNDRKTEKTGKSVSPQQQIVQELERNEENKYSGPDSKKLKINYAKEPNGAQKNNLKEDIL